MSEWHSSFRTTSSAGTVELLAQLRIFGQGATWHISIGESLAPLGTNGYITILKKNHKNMHIEHYFSYMSYLNIKCDFLTSITKLELYIYSHMYATSNWKSFLISLIPRLLAWFLVGNHLEAKVTKGHVIVRIFLFLPFEAFCRVKPWWCMKQ